MTQVVQHIRRMRDGAQSHVMRCSDGNFYVIVPEQPSATRVLANNCLGPWLAAVVGLSVPTPAIVEMHLWLVDVNCSFSGLFDCRR